MMSISEPARCRLPDAATEKTSVIPPLLSVAGLRSGHGKVPVIRGATFSLAAGERVGILGQNGAGKTTLLRTLVGELVTTSGTIGFGGSDITCWTTTQRARAGIGYVPQGRAIFAGLSVHENLRMGCLTNPAPETDVIGHILERIPRLKAYINRQGGSLSGGEQQLLAVARCLCASPSLILLDEPTEGIQPSIREEMIEILQASAETGTAILLVEQNLQFLAAFSERILQFERGTINCDGGD
jgi:branched-chain amino acid transport system ATP-binding protein